MTDPNTLADRSALERMVALDEELEATHPGWMTGTNEAEKIVVTHGGPKFVTIKGRVNEITGWGEFDRLRKGGATLEGLHWSDPREALAAAERRGLERAAGVIQERMDSRFEEHGTREWDTNACYYEGAAGETYEALDEEAEDCLTAIRKLAGGTDD